MRSALWPFRLNALVQPFIGGQRNVLWGHLALPDQVTIQAAAWDSAPLLHRHFTEVDVCESEVSFVEGHCRIAWRRRVADVAPPPSAASLVF